MPDYDPRYLAGIVLFNGRDFFEAHEVWEDLWQECTDENRRFYQGLIQAAVGLLHFGNGNVRGASKLYRTSRAYMERYPSPHLGLDVTAFWERMERCFVPVNTSASPDQGAVLDEQLIPTIQLDPPPDAWPNPADYVESEDA